MKKQYEEPTIETILFNEQRNVFTLRSEEAGDDNFVDGEWSS